MRTYHCPECGAEVPLRNINIEKDVMLCPACGESTSFSRVAGTARDEEEETALLAASPPEHLSSRTEIDPSDAGETRILVYRKVDKTAFLLIPFTIVWTGGSIGGIYGGQIAQRSFDLAESLFGLPFLAGSVLLVANCLYMLFGRQVLKLKRGKGVYFSGVGPFGRTVRFACNRETRVSAFAGTTGARSQLELETPGVAGKTKLFKGLDDDALLYAGAVLRREIRRL